MFWSLKEVNLLIDMKLEREKMMAIEEMRVKEGDEEGVELE